MDDLHLIDLVQEKRGYRRFITSWLHRGPDLTYLVDTGPACTADDLLRALRRLGVARLDWILLTHVHLDHAGAAGHVADAFPEARVVCWPKAAPHLVEPSRLWEGSLQVLGDTARMFGEPAPLDPGRILHPDRLASRGLRWLHTPGHAPHHVSYVHGDVLYGGEAAGMTCPTRSGVPYLRPATPPRFYLDVALDSLAKLQALDPPPARFAFAHYGLAEDTASILRHGLAQLTSWVASVRDLCVETGAGAWSPEFQAQAIARLSQNDPLFAPFADLEDDLQDREREYIRNTLEGMLGHLARESQA
ncbi:MBL fold metallo-hydrolase [bacterium]|nr:MBL fold metallo-hydrolase [bacterium]MBU1676921.1 MBL fold metallo-hydrolase [bacterium]